MRQLLQERVQDISKWGMKYLVIQVIKKKIFLIFVYIYIL